VFLYWLFNELYPLYINDVLQVFFEEFQFYNFQALAKALKLRS
jgi:hypothetical protein